MRKKIKKCGTRMQYTRIRCAVKFGMYEDFEKDDATKLSTKK